MLAIEQHQRNEFFGQAYNIEANIQDPYPQPNMNSFGSFDANASFHPLPFPYIDDQSFYSDMQHGMKPPIMRSTSNSSVPQLANYGGELPPSLSAPSVASAASSTVGSPYSGHSHAVASQESFNNSARGLGLQPTIVNHDGFSQDFVAHTGDFELSFGLQNKPSSDFVDPSLISGPRSVFGDVSTFSDNAAFQNQLYPYFTGSSAPSPAAPSPQAFPSYPTNHFSPPMTVNNFPDHPAFMKRRDSMGSYHSPPSYPGSNHGFGSDEEGNSKGRCAECGRVFKDLKAHLLTHQSERPEKCPIPTCEYYHKGFARKYDKNRHTLTHYKGTMVCGFCPGSGSAAEKSFNRADVFKRHLTSVHGVEQTAPNSKHRSPTTTARRLSSYCADATGKCSTCSQTFSNAQDFYEHLDDCVMRVVQQEDPSERINAQRLAEVDDDKEVQETFDRHMIKREDSMGSIQEEEEEDDEEEDEEDDSTESFSRGTIKCNKPIGSSRAVLNGGIAKSNKSSKKCSMTWSKGGVPLIGKGRKKRKHYPPSWGMSADKMSMKKRVLCVYDGERRLWKDDLMMHNEFEVRMKLADGQSYVTDLDVETLKRAEAFHNATNEEKGPWLPEQAYTGQRFDLNELGLE